MEEKRVKKVSITSSAQWNTIAEKARAAGGKLPPVDSVRARGWMLTIPAEHHTQEEVQKILGSVPYAAVFSEESGSSTGYLHFQCYAYWESAVSGRRVRSLFEDAHVEPARKPSIACARYCSKDRTHVSGPFWLGQYEKIPGMAPTPEERTRRARSDDAIEQVKSGWRYEDFVLDDSWRAYALTHERAIKSLISAYTYEQYGNKDRQISVDYIFGPAGSGKTSSILDVFGRRDTFIASLSSSFPFDGYEGEKILLLDDFRSSLPYSELLRILDPYPYRVNIKGSSRYACWEKIILTSNIPLAEQYPHISESKAPLYRRFEHGIVWEKKSPSYTLPYSSREDAMLGIRDDGGHTGVPGWLPEWEQAPENTESLLA